MKVKTSEASGQVLDWMVAKCEGYYATIKPTEVVYVHPDGTWHHNGNWSPHYDWAQGGPILSEAHISRTIDHSGLWIAYWTDGYDDSDAGKKWMQCDRSELVAGLRCYVASKLGDEVEVPDELRTA